jgi:hypothetical protein
MVKKPKLLFSRLTMRGKDCLPLAFPPKIRRYRPSGRSHLSAKPVRIELYWTVLADKNGPGFTKILLN